MTHPKQPNTEPQNEELQENKYLRRIRSFVLREGRLTKGQQRSLDLKTCGYLSTIPYKFNTTPLPITA
jgi:tRNA (guanine-N7-)-methyltransferase